MKKFVLFLLIVSLTFGVAACSQTKIQLPNRDVPVTEEAAQSFENKIASIKNAPAGDVKIQFTESEITSYINLKLVNGDVPIQHPTIWLSSGKVYIKGKLQGSNLPVKGDAILVVALAVQNQNLSLHVEKALIGGIPVPQAVLDQLTNMINDKVSTQFGPVTIKDLQILEGEAIVQLSR